MQMPAGGRSLRILVIDDEEAARRAVAAGVREAGYEVAEAADGPAGLEAAMRGGPDLVVLDLRLPGLDGERVLERLRQVSSVPVIVLRLRRKLGHDLITTRRGQGFIIDGT